MSSLVGAPATPAQAAAAAAATAAAASSASASASASAQAAGVPSAASTVPAAAAAASAAGGVSGATTVGGRQVADCVLELLYHQVIRHVRERNPLAVALRELERMGFAAGVRLCERCVGEKRRGSDVVDCLRVIAKEMWTLAYGHNISSLKRNMTAEGVYVLYDTAHRGLQRVSINVSADAELFLAFPSGLIRGALATFGLHASVSAEYHQQPCTAAFTVAIIADPSAR